MHSSKLLSFFLDNRVFAFWRQTDRQTNRWTGSLRETGETALAVASGGFASSSAVAKRPRDASCLVLASIVHYIERNFLLLVTSA